MIKVKILHISKYYPPYRGGIEDVCYNIVNNTSNHFEQNVICFNNNNHNEVTKINGIEIVRVGILKKIANQPISISFYRILKEYIKTYNPDIIHLHLPNPLISLFVLILIPKSVKLLLHWHSDIVAQKNIYRLFSPIEQYLLRRANKILVTSPLYLEDSKPLSKFHKKTVIIPNMISLEKMRLDKESEEKINKLISSYDRKKIVFFLGRHVAYKGIEYLIKSEKYIKSDCIILIAGEGPITPQLKKITNSNRIKFIGRITDEDIKIYMNAASVFAFPSITKNEAFGVVLAEAMYSKAVPVTFTIKGSGVNWVNINNITGIEVENRNEKEFGKAIDLLLKNDKLRSKLANNAYKRVQDNFTMETIKNKIEFIYSTLLKEI
ncbi:glycosyltransferase [Parabacteroides faecis]|uniref:Glycosyltransferase involved in cell wall biosynthesis n=1 Tax=Parabacteroides faecis TaxID=1217282 RepID=A0ABR6KJU8_9BACT|nr:glycosyltransferase [Parabacteroides faecis]MBB4621118.1 glycosyltransferase involved in cell wall biosynthesis [Parabacteroides faecis]GGJ89048.1 mannosyltransferase [Parabacteroides faecis]